MPSIDNNITPVTRTLPDSSGDYVEVGTFSFSNGAGSVEVSVTVAGASFSASKKYLLGLSNDTGPNGTFVTAIPFHSTGADSSEDFELVVRRSSNDLDLRLLRTGGSQTGVTALIELSRSGTNTDVFPDPPRPGP